MNNNLQSLKEAVMRAYEKGELSTVNEWISGFEKELRESKEITRYSIGEEIYLIIPEKEILGE